MGNYDMKKANEVYASICNMLDTRGWHYDKIEEMLVIKSGVKGDDFPIEFVLRVNPVNEIISFISLLPFNVEESKRLDLALAVCAANFGLADGSFDYNLKDGSILFRLTTGYRESILSDNLLERMILIAAATVDKYNDQFFMIAKGMLPVEQFIAAEQSED